MRITGVEAVDVRFPTSRTLDGSDAMNPDPDYSAAYAILRTDGPLEGHGFTFTIGRGNEVCVAAIEALAPLVVGLETDDVFADMGAFWRRLTGDSQLRWIGPEKGVIHLATAAIVNAVWDLYAKSEGVPLWKLLSGMSPAELVSCIDFRYLTDALTPEEALELLAAQEPTRPGARPSCSSTATPRTRRRRAGSATTTSRCAASSARPGPRAGRTSSSRSARTRPTTIRRAALLRDELGEGAKLMMDANQVWDVGEAIEAMRLLGRFDPYWIEEPTSPDDVLGHAAIARAIAPIRVATGEHVHNRVMFKQLLQASAIGFCQIDACRLGGVNEALAVILLAAKFGVPVCPHAGGVGLCELVQHLAIFDYVCVSADLTDRVIEYVDHLHEHFVHPVVLRGGRYMPPLEPGYSAELRPQSLADHTFPGGAAWA